MEANSVAILEVIIGFIISLASSIISTLFLLRLRLGVYHLKKPENQDDSIFTYLIRVKNTGIRTIKLTEEDTLKLNFNSKAEILEKRITQKNPELIKIPTQLEENENNRTTKLRLPFNFLNRFEYFDIHLKIKKIDKPPIITYEFRIPNISKPINQVKYRFLRRFKLYIAKSFQIIGGLYPFIAFTIIISLSLIDKQILINFKNSQNSATIVLGYFISHYFFLIVGYALED